MELVGDIGDVAAAYYQFNMDNLAEWFGLDDPVTAAEVGVSQVWDSDLGDFVAVSPDERLFPAFSGMPQGWSWALHFCNSSVEWNMSKKIPA